MKKLKNLSLILGVAVALVSSAMPAWANPANSPVQYSVKYVCGLAPLQPPGEEPPVKPGNYATAINIHNYTSTLAFDAAVRVTVHYRHGMPLPPIIPPKTKKAYRFRTLEVDCADIWAMVGVPPGTFLKGMLHLGLPQPLPVAAVYTSQTNLGGGSVDPGAGMSIDVEYVAPFLSPPVMP